MLYMKKIFYVEDDLRSLDSPVKEAALLSGGMAADTSVSFVSWRQVNTLWLVSFNILWPLCRHLTSPVSPMFCGWCQ